MLINYGGNDFKKLISEGYTLVDFYADWCGPCQMIAPVLEEIAKERDDLNILKVNTDQFGDVAIEYGVKNIPTLVIIKDGETLGEAKGFMPKDALNKFIDGAKKL